MFLEIEDELKKKLSELALKVTNELDITFDLYFIVKALSFEFYCQVRVEIEFPLFKSEYSYDFFRTKLFSLETEYHTSKKVPKKYEGGKNFPIVFGNPGHND